MNERELLAAECALGVLEGEELLRARGLMASDADFARLVGEWEERLAPMFAEFGDAVPPTELRQRILDELDDGVIGEVVALKRRLGWWKGVSAAASALAASLALVVAYDATQTPAVIEQPVAAVMVASLMSEDKVTMVSAAWRPEQRQLMIMPGAMQDAAGHDHELWVIPADGKPRSLGLVHAAGGMMAVAPAMAPHLGNANVTLALSVEPAGGSPTGLPTGPVVASGPLQKV